MTIAPIIILIALPALTALLSGRQISEKKADPAPQPAE
jgi:hypothetical protein